MRERGFSMFELLVVLFIVGVMAAVSIPHLKAYAVEAHLLGAGRVFAGEFRKARSIAVRSNVNTAIRFESRNGVDFYSTYQDGNGNGVRSADIASGVDPRIAGPLRLDAGAHDVRVGHQPRRAGAAAGDGDAGPDGSHPLRSVQHALVHAARHGDSRAPSTWPARRSRPECASPPAAPASA